AGNTNPQGIADPPPAVNVDLAATLNPAPGGAAYPTDDLPSGQLAPPRITLLAEGGPPTGRPSTDPLPSTDPRPLVQGSLTPPEATGLTAEQRALRRSVTIHLVDLGGAYLGLVSRNPILIDATPRDDSEFTTPGDQGEQGRMDLLTALPHEVGHLLGLGHD